MAARTRLASRGALAQRGALAMAGALVLAVASPVLVSGCGSKGPDRLTPAELKDPQTCKACHPTQFEQWSQSMHAYASDDPVFVAMNQRGQRETNNELGDFCVKCHAPVALSEGLTTNGLDLANVPASARGVTCYFCHSAESIAGDHNNPLALAKDGRIFGPFADPEPSPHLSRYTTLLDGTQSDSAAACGSCHDIVNQHQVPLERTFQEWSATLFSIQPHGLTCAQCHMSPTVQGVASTMSTTTRTLHPHDFPAVDVSLSAFPGADPVVQRQQAQAFLDTTVQVTVCVDDIARNFTVALDNVAAGHSWPSGASQDRRAWVDVTAYAADQSIYHSGLAPSETVEEAADPDLWTIRDCIFDQSGAEAHMFWQAASYTANAVPGPVMQVLSNPGSFTRSHQKRIYPGAGTFTQPPDRIAVKVYLKAIGDDVLASLVDSHDLDPAVAAAVPQYQLGGGGNYEWTRAKATARRDSKSGNQLLCVNVGRYTPVETIPAATSHRRCDPPPSP